MMVRHLVAMTAAGAALVLTTACGADSEANTAPEGVVAAPSGLVEQGTLTYGTAASFPPFEFKEGGEPTGFDIEMGQELAHAMGLRPSILDIDFDGLIPALQGGRIDIINSAMYINDERAQEVDFIPYMKIGEALLVRDDSDVQIEDVPEDLSGLTVAVTRGAIGETYMNDFNDELEAAGLEPMTVMTLPNNQDALAAVRSGRADAFDTSTPGAAYTISQTDDIRHEATFALDTQIGIAVRKGDDEIKAAVTSALEEFVSSGKYAELMEKYDLPAESNLFE